MDKDAMSESDQSRGAIKHTEKMTDGGSPKEQQDKMHAGGSRASSRVSKKRGRGKGSEGQDQDRGAKLLRPIHRRMIAKLKILCRAHLIHVIVRARASVPWRAPLTDATQSTSGSWGTESPN